MRKAKNEQRASHDERAVNKLRPRPTRISKTDGKVPEVGPEVVRTTHGSSESLGPCLQNSDRDVTRELKRGTDEVV